MTGLPARKFRIFDTAKLDLIVKDAVGKLDGSDFDERMAWCEANEEIGWRIEDEPDGWWLLSWGGRPLCRVHRDRLRRHAATTAEHN